MPIWFELIILMLFTYAIGIAIGWLLWARSPIVPVHTGHSKSSEGDTTQ